MTLQELQTALLNYIMNYRLDPNATTIVVHDKKANTLTSLEGVQCSGTNGESTIILSINKK